MEKSYFEQLVELMPKSDGVASLDEAIRRMTSKRNELRREAEQLGEEYRAALLKLPAAKLRRILEEAEEVKITVAQADAMLGELQGRLSAAREAERVERFRAERATIVSRLDSVKAEFEACYPELARQLAALLGKVQSARMGAEDFNRRLGVPDLAKKEVHALAVDRREMNSLSPCILERSVLIDPETPADQRVFPKYAWLNKSYWTGAAYLDASQVQTSSLKTIGRPYEQTPDPVNQADPGYVGPASWRSEIYGYGGKAQPER